MEPVLLVDLAAAHEPRLVGNKAHALQTMISSGLKVPLGFVITTEAYQAQGKDRAIAPALRKAILRHFDALRADFVAVRSSAVGEDGTAAAWAGQLETHLNTTRQTLMRNIESCWASADSPRAVSYAKQHGITVGPVAVIVQKMVQSDVSGVAFSVHPITGDSSQIVIEAGLGLGEAVVSGEITPDMYIVGKTGGEILQKYVAHQAKRLVKLQSGKTAWQDLSDEGAQQKLSNEQIDELGKMVTALETYFGHPVDVEWAIEQGQLYILQSRPITTLTTSGQT